MANYAKKIIQAAMAKRYDEAVAHVYSYRTSYLKIANSKVDSIVTKDEESGSLFVSSKKRVFHTNIDRLSDSSIAAALRVAGANINGLQSKDDYNGIAQGPFKYAKEAGCDAKIVNYDNDLLCDVAYTAINSALDAGADNVAGTLIMSASKSTLSTSKDVNEEEESAYARLSLRTFVKGFSAQNVTAAKRLKDLKPEGFASSTAELAGMATKTGRISSGKYDVIYMQQPSGALFSMVNEMACIGNVETGGFLTGKLGKEIAHKSLTIYDDGGNPGLMSTSRFDEEGHPTQRTALVGDGKLLTYLHNNSTAIKYKTKSTGNAGLILPSPNVSVIKHDKKIGKLDDLIRRVDKGILVTNTWYTRFSNYLSGDFSTVPRDIAIYIEKGSPKFAIKQVDVGSATGIRVSENIIRMMKNVECSANDSIQTASWDADGYFVTPSVLVSGVSVTTA
jgi:PmbA protein